VKRVQAVALLTIAAAAALPSAAPAQGTLPVGENDGVRIIRPAGALVVVFTPSAQRLWRRVAGRNVSVLCTRFANGSHGGGVTTRAPKRGRRIRTGDMTPRQDFCRVWLAQRKIKRNGRTTVYARELLVSVPLTQRGAVFLDEEEKVHAFFGVVLLAGLEAEERGRRHLPTADELLTWRPRLGRAMVALPGPQDTPPPGKVGYWSDGSGSYAGVGVSRLGRRLFVHQEGEVLHTNVAGYIYNDIE
jgi:hypothetical protein